MAAPPSTPVTSAAAAATAAQLLSSPLEAKMFVYLFKLQKSGTCNMFAAGGPLRANFPGTTEQEAIRVLLKWSKNWAALKHLLVE